MVEVTLLAGSALALASALIYGAVAALLRRRKAPGPSGRANTLFAVWWLGLAAFTLVDTAVILGGALGYTALVLHAAALYVKVLLLCVALWALLYYLLFLFTGRSGLLVPLALFYAVVFVLLVVLLTSANPIGVNVARFNTVVAYERPLTGVVYNGLIALLLFPQILGALAYGSLYFKLKDPTRRFRVAIISGSIVVWFLSSYLATAAGVNQQDWWVVTSRLLGLGAALAVLVAYQPPRALRQRFGLTTVLEETRGDEVATGRSPPSLGPAAAKPAPKLAASSA